MHIILMLVGMIVGLSVGTNISWFLGLPAMAGSLLFLSVGSNAWREKQEAFALFVGLCCGGLVFLVSVFG